MDRWSGRVALVTGASAGIGAGICKNLVKAGMVVIGAARAVERIEAMAEDLEDESGTLIGVKCDLTKDEEVANLFAYIKENYEGVDVCINNAAMAFNSGLLDGSPEEWRYMLNLNVVAVCLCTKLSVESMRERGVDDGHIININSVVGRHVPSGFPSVRFYASTKHAITALTEGMRLELRDLNSNIRISSISPGYVKTEFMARSIGEEMADTFLQGLPGLEASDVADSVCHILAAPQHVQIHDLIVRANNEAS